MGKFIGRKSELAQFKLLLSKKSASLIVVRGRRRIGKSRLIEEFASNYRFLRFSGVPPMQNMSAKLQRDLFFNQLQQQLNLPLPPGGWTTDSWGDLFRLLADHTRKGRVIILFDEISWMGSMDPTFLGQLKNAWDMELSKNDELSLFLCGSVSTWIEKNIINSTAFFGRISKQIVLGELTLPESNLFLVSQGFMGTDYEKLKLLSVTGGIPWYLEQINPQLSADENIKNLCFRKDGILVKEFDMIFNDLFSKKGGTYKRIINILSKSSIEFNELCHALSYEKGGVLSTYLDDLIKAGFVERDYTWLIKTGKESRLSKFRLSDNYLRFYLRYVEPNLPKITRDAFADIGISSLPGWDTLMGFQFENLVLNNRKLIRKLLYLRAEDLVYDNPYFQRRTATHKGCQIDYLLQTRHNLIFACEIKFSRREIKIDVIEEMKNKLNNFSLPRGFACSPVLIHANGVDDAVVDANYFTSIIDFGSLLQYG
jgi:AAA+ ATPase superfamily predicted ATPase